MAHQPCDMDYQKRWAACNCLTVYAPDTYAGHGISNDQFIKLAKAGTKITMPFADEWPGDIFPRAYKFPQKISTFLYSPYSEANSPSTIFPKLNDGIRYTMGAAGPILNDAGYSVNVPKPSLDHFKKELKQIDAKIDEIWGKDICKMFVFYDASRGDARDIAKMNKYHDACLETLDWPMVAVWVDADEPREGQPGWDGWHHYRMKPTIERLYDDIDKAEAEFFAKKGK